MVSACPAAVVEAPIGRVWAVQADSRNYGDWAGASFTRMNPPGRVAPRQVLEADTRELAITFNVRIQIEAVDPARHQVVFELSPPFGVREKTTITATPIDSLQFG